MQREWDLAKGTSKMNLIISGSIYSLMHRIFEDSKEPLFSRANRIIQLKAFETDVLKEILKDFNPAYSQSDLLTLYMLSNGVAWYVNLFMSNGKTSWWLSRPSYVALQFDRASRTHFLQAKDQEREIYSW